MNRKLAKKCICLCGNEKNITWIEPKFFRKGIDSFCVGHSDCDKCGLTQSHYTGDMENYLAFKEAMENMEKSNDSNVVKH